MSTIIRKALEHVADDNGFVNRVDGEPDTRFYPRDALQPGPKTKTTMHSRTNILRLVSLGRHRGTEVRMRLYADRAEMTERGIGQ